MAQGIQKRVGKLGTSYRVRVDLPPDPVTGKRVRRSETFASEREAKAAYAKWRADVERGTVLDVSKLTVREYLESWLDALGESVRPATRRRYSDLLRHHVMPSLGNVRLTKLAASHVRKLYADLLTAGLSNMTVRLVHQVLHRALKAALHDDLLPRNVTEAVRAPRKTTPEYAAWNAEQAMRVLAAADETEDAALWRLSLLTGMRRGELLGLKWEDVDLEQGVLGVRRARKRSASGGWETDIPKTPSSRRPIALPSSVVESLRRHGARQAGARRLLGAAYHDLGYVFATPVGGPLHVNSLMNRYAKLIARAGVPRIRFHDIRHTAATLMLKNGEHPKKVQAQLGHANISITLDRYSHATMEMQRDAAERLDALLGRVRPEGTGDQNGTK